MGVVWHSISLALILTATALASSIVLSNAPLITSQVPRDVGALWMMQILDKGSDTRYRFGVLGWCKNKAEERASICVTKLLWKLPRDSAGEGFLQSLPSSLSSSASDVGFCLVIVMLSAFGLLGTILIWATCKQPLYIWPGKPQFFGGMPQTVRQVGNDKMVPKPSFISLSPQAIAAFIFNLLIFIFSIPNWVYIRRAVNDVRDMDPALDTSYAYGFKSSIAVYLLSSVGLLLWSHGGLQRAHKGQHYLPKA